MINSVAFKKKHNIPVGDGLSLKEIAKLSKMPVKALQEVYNKGIGAYKTNPQSVRPMVKSAEQWAYARVYAFVMKTKSVFYGADKSIKEKYGIK